MADQYAAGSTDDLSLTPTAEEVLAPIPREDQDMLVKKLKYETDCFKSDMAPLHSRIDRWHELYEAKPKKDKDWPWPGASNYSVPLAMSTVDSIHARIMKSVFEEDPLFLARARTDAAAQTAKKAEQYLDNWLDAMRVVATHDDIGMNMLIEGTGIMKLDWVRDTRQLPPQFSMPSPTNPVPGRLPTEVVEYEGPRGYAVPLKDFILIPADSPTIDDAVYVGHKVYLTRQQLERRRDVGLYFNVNELLSRTGDSTSEKTPNPSGIIAKSDSHGEYPETRQYEIIELYGPYVFDPQRGSEPALFTFSSEHNLLLRLTPYPYKVGRAPYIDYCIFPRPNFFWGRSLVEMLESPQEELTALHNMRGDAISRQIAPPIMRRFGSRWDPEKQPWKPGSVIDVNDPAEIVELGLAPVPHAIFAHEQEIQANTERMTGMSDVFMGRVGSPYQTATATTAARSEGLVRMDVSVTRWQESMKKLAWTVWWMLYQFRPLMDTFNVQDQQVTILKQDMAPGPNGLMPFDFIPQGMQSDASKEARRQQLIFLLNTAAGPLSQFYPDGIQKLLYEVFGAFDIRNREEILGPPWSVIQQQIQQAMQAGFQEGTKQAQAAAQ